MNYFKKYLFLSFTFSFYTLLNSAQTGPFPVIAMSISTESVGADTLSDGLPADPDSVTYNAEMLISLSDTTDIDLIKVKLDTISGGQGLLSMNYTFDQFGSLGSYRSYARSGYDVLLGLGHFQGLIKYFAEIRVKKLNGSYSDIVSFNR